MIDERLLHYIWQSQSFDKSDLKTVSGSSLHIFHPGFKNEHAGPDFQNARIKHANIEWAGRVELHIKSSDWYAHGHQHDPAYQQVILHVVWQFDKEVIIHTGETVPVLELKDKVNPLLIQRYRQLMMQADQLPCAGQVKELDAFTRLSQIEKSLAERLEQKAILAINTYAQTGQDWEETGFRILLRSFGMKVNQEPFEQLAKQIPFKTLLKNADKPLLIEALLFGQAGFLGKTPSDDYTTQLLHEYQYQQQKYQLPEPMMRHQWNFGKVRVPNFPTVRLAQVAALISASPSIWNLIFRLSDNSQAHIHIKLSDYWVQHYDVGKPLTKGKFNFPATLWSHLMINAVAPLLAARAKVENDQDLMEKAIHLLSLLRPEVNQITKIFKQLNFTLQNAADSQGMIQLYQNYCKKKRCLSCQIGTKLIAAKS